MTTAVSIDKDKKTVKLANGTTLPYDRLVIAPGIDIKFDSVPGYSEAVSNIMPHAWKPGPQTQLLQESAQCAQGRRLDRHDHAAEPVSLPARTV